MRPRQFSNPHRWYDDYVRSARFSGNEASQSLGEIYYKTGRSTRREEVANFCNQGLKLAKSLDEPYWEIYFRLVGYDMTSDTTVTDELIQLSIDINQPRYEGCPFAVRVYHALLNAYSISDPLGQASEIIDGSNYVEQNLPLDEDTYLSLSMFRFQVYRAQRKWEQAYLEGMEYHNRAMEEAHWYHTIRSSILLAEILYRTANFTHALDIISHCQTALSKRKDPSWEMTALWWYLIIYKRIDDTDNYEKVLNQIKSMRQVNSYDYLSGRAKIELRRLNKEHQSTLNNVNAMREVFDGQKYLHLQIELYFDYLAILESSPLWDRIFYYGSESPAISFFSKQVNRWGKLSPIYFVMHLIGIIIACIVGTPLELTGHQKKKTLKEVRELMYQSAARDIYEQRLTRILAGDYTQLS